MSMDWEEIKQRAEKRAREIAAKLPQIGGNENDILREAIVQITKILAKAAKEEGLDARKIETLLRASNTDTALALELARQRMISAKLDDALALRERVEARMDAILKTAQRAAVDLAIAAFLGL